MLWETWAALKALHENKLGSIPKKAWELPMLRTRIDPALLDNHSFLYE